jgi:hypothetical protein
MLTGDHIPVYLLCERFARGGTVLDMFPPDLAGARALLDAAERVVVVSEKRHPDPPAPDGPQPTVLLSSPEKPPLAHASFALVLINLTSAACGAELVDSRIRAARRLIHPAGLLAVRIPNRKAPAVVPAPAVEAPDFLDFERLLRRHFPHVALFAEEPLHGSVLSPLGRRAGREAPLFDDRMLPDGGDVPTGFVGLCSPRYQRVDDATIARLPFSDLAERVRLRLERLEGTLDVVRRESQAHRREAESLRENSRALQERLSSNDELQHRAQQLESRLSELESELRRREERLDESERRHEGLEEERAELERKLHEARRDNRRLERKVEEADRMRQMATGEREDTEQERAELLERLREARAEAKAKQRRIDDLVEQLAGSESELATLQQEASRQRRELVAARERCRALELEAQDAEDADSRAAAAEADRDRLRAQAIADRERLEQSIERERRLRVEAESRRDASLADLEAAEGQIAELRQRAEQASRLEEQVEDLQRKLAEADSALVEAEEWAVEAQGARREISGLEQRIGELVEEAERGGELERRAEELEKQIQSAAASALEYRREAERLRPEAHSAESVRQRARTAEAQLSDLKGQREELRAELSEVRARAERLESDLGTAMDALADSEEGAEMTAQSAADRIRAMMEENRQLREESEAELLRVSKDLEVELRWANAQLEAREGELWQLREEAIRLRAQMAASAAAADKEGEEPALKRSLAEQEEVIVKLREQIDALRERCESQEKSLAVRKKNLRILAALLKRERENRQEPRPDGEEAPTSFQRTAARSPLDLDALIADTGSDTQEDLDELDEFGDVDEAIDTLRMERPDGDPDPDRGTG